MRILISSTHRYPADGALGSGRKPKAFPSGSAHHIFDLTARGLTEQGHDVFYHLPRGWEPSSDLPFTPVEQPRFDVDAAHVLAYRNEALAEQLDRHAIPWVASCHRDPRIEGKQRGTVGDNWIFVSRSLADAYGSDRYVLNGLDPADYLYAEDKQDYLLFMAALEWARRKGLEDALSLARDSGVRLVIAGTGQTQEIIDDVAALCRAGGAEFVGDVRGRDKARLFGGARAFLFPTALEESFGLCMVEALLSGTPVIASDLGACPEIVTPDVGFICRFRQDYLAAIERCAEIDPRACRAKAERCYHYSRMAADYAREYLFEREAVATAL
jgi:glycosyltransferase involved in cell wall biosynthesis